MSSQPELLARLREARPAAPPELRERIRLVTAQAPPTRRILTWRRALVVLVPVAVAGALAAAFLPRGERPAAVGPQVYEGTGTDVEKSLATAPSATDSAAAGASESLAPGAPPPDTGRAQRYSATLELRVPDANAVSTATTRALQIVASVGGYPLKVNVDAREEDGSAYLLARVPRNRVQDAVRRLCALGTIVAENVQIQDIQAGIDTTGRLITRLEEQLAALRAQPQTDETRRRIAALTAQIDRQERARDAALRAAQYATVELRVATPADEASPAGNTDGPLHGIAVVFRWIGIGAVYALALGLPVIGLLALVWLLTRRLGARREERLLSRP
jgi:hypothetical protein